MNTIFKSEKDKKEFVHAFKKLTMSGAVTRDQAIETLIRKNPHYFHQPTADELKKIARLEMNDEIRSRARQPNKLTIDLFASIQPTDKPR
jgi:Tfp pilus assembly protein FimV